MTTDRTASGTIAGSAIRAIVRVTIFPGDLIPIIIATHRPMTFHDQGSTSRNGIASITRRLIHTSHVTFLAVLCIRVGIAAERYMTRHGTSSRAVACLRIDPA